jgi:hypothetical protein
MRILWKLFTIGSPSKIDWKHKTILVRPESTNILTNIIEYDMSITTKVPSNLDEPLSSTNIKAQFKVAREENILDLPVGIQYTLHSYPLVEPDELHKYTNKKKCVAIIIVFLRKRIANYDIYKNHIGLTQIQRDAKFNMLSSLMSKYSFSFGPIRKIHASQDKLIDFDMDKIVKTISSTFTKLTIHNI